MWVYVLVRFLHILSAVLFIGGLLARQMVRAYAINVKDIHSYAALQRSAEIIDRVMVIAGSMGVTVFGILLTLIVGAPIFGFLQGAQANWLLVSVLLLLGGMLIVPLIFVPWRKKLDGLLHHALAEGEITPQLRLEAENPKVRFFHLLEMAAVVVILYLMVAKPF